MPSPIARRLLTAATVTLSFALAACGAPAATPSPTATATPSPTATPTPTPSVSVPVTNTLDGIKVTGDPGAAPTITVPAPMAIDETRSKVLIEGKGNVVGTGALVDVHYSGVNGRTGETFDSSWARGETVAFPLVQVVPGFSKGLEGKKVGDRVLIAMPGPDGYDAMGGNANAGIVVGDTLVFVVDIVETSVETASGAAVTPAPGLPAVTMVDNLPTVAIPAGAAVPTTTAVQPLIKGLGRAVGEKDYIAVNYRSWSWQTGKLLEDKFTTADGGNIAETIPAWRQGLIGQPIGSRVLIVASPADSYPEGSNNPAVTKGDAVVYVVDILYSDPKAWGD